MDSQLWGVDARRRASDETNWVTPRIDVLHIGGFGRIR